MEKMGKTAKPPEGIYAWNALFSATACNFSRDLSERQGGMQIMIAGSSVGQAECSVVCVLKGRRCNFCIDGIKGYGRYFLFFNPGSSCAKRKLILYYR